VIVFQTPLVILGLVYLGILSSRTLRRQRRVGYLITAAIALALPGPDPVTTFLELLPMWLLFEGSIWLAVLYERRWAKTAPASATLGG
jgi:sec-independent protein translocase protein TatC